MELNISMGLTKLYPYPVHYSQNQFYKLFTPKSKPTNQWRPLIRLKKSSYSFSRVSNKSPDFEMGNNRYPLDQNEDFVEVIGIGSRTEAVFDFCLHSPFVSPVLRFSNLVIAGSIDFSFSKAVVVLVVATSTYVLEHHMRVVEIVKRVKSANGVVVGIIVKPFSFEGRKRRGQVEVKDLVEKLQEQTDFCIGIDPDVLLEKDDFFTLDEALKTANTAVLMALNAVSVLVSKSKKKKKLVTFSLQDDDNMKELVQVTEILEILKGYKQGEVGFGDGYNIKTSTMRAIYDCPFLSASGLKGLDGIVIGFISSSVGIDLSEIKVFLNTLRQNTDFKGQIILCLVHEPILEPNHVTTTVITVSNQTGHQAAEKSSIFSRLSQHFPFIFNLLKRQQPSESHNIEKNPTDSLEMPDLIYENSDIEEGCGNYSAELQTLLTNNEDGEYNLSVPEANENGFSEPAPNNSSFYDRNNKGVTSYEREPLIRIFEPGQEEWSNDSEDTSLLDKLSIVKLPVGVKPSAEFKNSLDNSDSSSDQQKEVADDNIKKSQQIHITSRVRTNTLANAGFEAVAELFDTGSPVLKGTTDSVLKREGVLSARAASMLEAEHHSQKKWNPIMEMQYRGGLYKGRCQGGLPEGKGRLSLSDGSIYDGMWRSGKRSGLGTFYFSNGDFYQGSWRDDLMHGKGWLYFQTGDRWFANFWKGKANGEGRFYSKFGEVFFGHFKDGWRHGNFLCIGVDGERYLENWDEGVCVSRRKQLDADFA